MVAAYVKGARTPFLESPLLYESPRENNVINIDAIKTARDLFADGIEDCDKNGKKCLVVGYRDDLVQQPDKVDDGIDIKSMKEAFDDIDVWLKKHFGINGKSPDQKPAD